MNSIINPFEKSSLKNNPGLLDLFFIGVIFLYVFSYPPFRSSSIIAYANFRITLEALVLIYLLIKTQMVIPGEFQVHLLLSVILVVYFGIISPEPIRNVLSFLNKLLFLFLLIKVFEHDYKLMDLFRKIWIFLGFLISFSAIIALIGHQTGWLPFSKGVMILDQYYHDSNPLFGSINYRIIGPYKIARVVGWMHEHGDLAYYFALNFILSETIYIKKSGYKWFMLINLIGGLLTFSVAFYLFILFYFILKIFNKKLKLIIYFISPIIIYYAIYFYQNPDLFLYTSMSDRVWRIEGAIDLLSKMNLIEKFFGMGTMQTILEVGGGVTVGFLNMFLGRGILLAIFYVFIIIKYTRYNTTLMAFVFYYSLISGQLFLNPVSLLITVLGYQSFKNQHFDPKPQLNKLAISK